MNEYAAVLTLTFAALATWKAATLQIELYAMQAVAAVYRATEQLAFEEGDAGWLKGETAKSIKMAYVMNAYRRMPAMVGICPDWLVRAMYGEQGFMDLVERQYERARKLSFEVDRKDDVKIDME